MKRKGTLMLGWTDGHGKHKVETITLVRRWLMPAVPYPSDLTNHEWQILAPLLPPAKPGGPPRSVVLTDWLSMMAALGVGSRPASRRTRSRSVV